MNTLSTDADARFRRARNTCIYPQSHFKHEADLLPLRRFISAKFKGSPKRRASLCFCSVARPPSRTRAVSVLGSGQEAWAPPSHP